MGWFRAVHAKSVGSREVRALLVARKRMKQQHDKKWRDAPLTRKHPSSTNVLRLFYQGDGRNAMANDEALKTYASSATLS
jgi:hypothetical protein